MFFAAQDSRICFAVLFSIYFRKNADDDENDDDDDDDNHDNDDDDDVIHRGKACTYLLSSGNENSA